MSDDVRLRTVPSTIQVAGDAWILVNPRLGEPGQHFHTYGLLTPYFKGLSEGKLLGTRCVNPRCPLHETSDQLWVPPRADCPDCHRPMTWAEVTKTTGYIYTYTYVERGGTGLEIECPYYQIDVRLPEVCTIVKSYLIDRKQVKIGDAVKAQFRTGADATHTCLDLYFVLTGAGNA